MRPVLNRQSALKAPLNEMLGREANLRVLRVLVETDNPVAASRLAELTKLHISGISRTVAHLEELGIVEVVGVGARRPAQFRRGHPLAPALEALFLAERARFSTVVDRLKDAARRTLPTPRAAWLQGPVVENRDSNADALIVGLLGGSRNLGAMTASFEDALGETEREMDVTIEIRGRTEADLRAGPADELEGLRVVQPLLGPPPLAILEPTLDRGDGTSATRRHRSFSHAELDVRARELAAAIALRLKTDPGLVTRARAHIAARLLQASNAEQLELREWDRILRSMSLPRLRRFLLDTGERATRLRQTFPFTGILSLAEREALLEAHRHGVSVGRP